MHYFKAATDNAVAGVVLVISDKEKGAFLLDKG